MLIQTIVLAATVFTSAQAPDGQNGGACFGNGTCMSGYECDANNVCRGPQPAVGAAAGQDGGTCFGNGTCMNGLECDVSNICRAPAHAGAPASPDESLAPAPSPTPIPSGMPPQSDPTDRAPTYDYGYNAAPTDSAASTDSDTSNSQSSSEKAAPAYQPEPGFFSKVFVFAPPSPLHPSANLFMHVLGGCLGGCGGQVWLPMIAGSTPNGYVGDAAIAWLVHMGAYIIVGGAIGVGGSVATGVASAVDPNLGALVSIPVGLLSLGLGVLSLVDHFYLIPMATLGAWNRAALKQDAMRQRTGLNLRQLDAKQAVAMAY